VFVLTDDDKRIVTLRVSCHLDPSAKDFVTEWEFVDLNGVKLGPKSQQAKYLYELNRLCPFFYLSAVRDAAREFQPRSQLWARYLRNPSMPAETRADLERDLAKLNDRILNAEPRLQRLRTSLAKAQEVVELADNDTVGIEALPARLWDILAKSQVVFGGSTGASLPLMRHGSGTQSLSVIFLFEAFLSALMEESSAQHSVPILAIEEPESHLHPCAIRSLSTTLHGFSGQKIIATHSGELVSEVDLYSIRRFHRVAGKVEVRQIGPNSLTTDDARKLQFHLFKTRSELLFARCWLMGEGVTEYWVFSETARFMGIDLERLGIRIVPFKQASAQVFAKVANDLGISWYCVADGDDGGRQTLKSLRDHFGTRSEPECLYLLPTATMELFLCENGLGKVYESNIATQKRSTVTATPGEPEYWTQVLRALPARLSKEQLAIDTMLLMRRQGKASIPQKLQDIVNHTRRLASA
jgi:putative ATP-dependent endonuclease of OLD family